MTNIGQIVAEITATTTGLRKAQQDANKQFGQIQNAANATGKITKLAFAVAAAAAVAAFTKELYKCYQGASETKKAMMGLESTAKAFGQNFEDANKSVKELYSDGIMPLDKSIRGFKNLLSVGFSVDEAMQISKALKNIGAFNNVVGDLGQAYEDSTKGLKTGSMELIENIGLTQRLSTVMKNANVDISNGIDITNNAAQRRAVYNAILAEGLKFEGDAAKLANDNASANAKLSAAWKELSDNLGNRVSPAFASVLGLATQITKATSEMFKKDRIDEANEYADSVRKQKDKFDELSATYTRLAAKQNKTAEETKVYKDTIAELKKQYPEFLEKIDMEKDGYEGVAEALSKVNDQLNKKLLFSMKEKEMAAQQQKIIDADLKKYEATVKQNKALSQQEVLIKKLSEKKESLQTGRYVTNSEGNKEFVKFTAADAKKDPAIEYINGEYMKKMLAVEDEYLLSTEKTRLDNMRVTFAKEIAEYDLQKKQATQEIININKKYDAISGYNPIEDEKKKAKEKAEAEAKAKAEAEAKAKKEEEARKKAEEEARKKAEFKPDTEKTLAQKKKELEYKMQADLINANKEEENIIKLKYASQAKILEIEDAFAKEVAGAKTQKQVEDAYDKMIKAIGEEELALKTSVTIEEGKANALAIWEEVQKEITGYGPIKIEVEAKPKYKEGYFEPAVGLTDVSNYGVTPKTRDDELSEEEKAEKELNEAINATISSFNALANELDSNFMKVLANVAESAMSLKSSYGTFTTGQKEGGLLGGLGMLSGGIGMFTSAVSIFQSVGGLFHKSTYNFDEAVKKMLKGIGEKAPELQAKEYSKALNIKTYLDSVGKTMWDVFSKEEIEKLNELGASVSESSIPYHGYMGFINEETRELLGTLDKIIPQLAEQLGTAAEDFGSDIASALSNASTFTAFSDNLEDNVYSSVKSGLIAAFLASETMKPLLDNLQQSMTIAVADGILSTEPSNDELANLKNQVAEIEKIAQPFYDALESVGFNLVDAADDMKSASDALSNSINRNLRLAERIQMNQAGTSQVINIDFTGANLGGVSEASMINLMNRATAQSNIAKTGVR